MAQNMHRIFHVNKWAEIGLHMVDDDMDELVMMRINVGGGRTEHLLSWHDKFRMKLPVRQQGGRACCWALVATDLVSYQLRQADIKYHKHRAAPQELIDMVDHARYPRYVRNRVWNHGCCGASVLLGLNYIRMHGIALEANYPFVRRRQNVNIENIPKQTRITIDAVHSMEKYSLERIKAVIRKHPVAGRIRPFESLKRWRGDATAGKIYMKHVLVEGDKEPEVNHAVVITGYGVDADGVEYYIIKNSWGRKWGVDGYAKVSIDLVTPTVYPLGVRLVSD
ncbi:hypothetical protein ABFS82_06G080100 [Erythranthe guttata]|uniref:cathepsin Q-like n=1 Tax=Erythranthe guttata TaxID=4155 RepID=UPI00064DD2CB|nr:PREDICTED: cathepsin Q-like [Erythranthe guttata]|eukprot:XP_012858102.1 PREDICTED: cathepsin Q-like [Erythranthe guttata]